MIKSTIDLIKKIYKKNSNSEIKKLDSFIQKNEKIEIKIINNMNKNFSDRYIDVPYYSTLSGKKFFDIDEAKSHFADVGIADRINPHPLIDLSYIFEQISKNHNNEFNIDNFLCIIDNNKLSPHPLFDIDFYLTRYGDVKQAGVPALRHFIEAGANEGRQPNEFFDADWYTQKNNLSVEGRYEAFMHFITEGDKNRLQSSPMFDPTAYTNKYNDAATYSQGALRHYICIGKKLGRNAIEMPTLTAGNQFDQQIVPLDFHLQTINRARSQLEIIKKRRIQGFQEKKSLIIDEDAIARASKIAINNAKKPKLNNGGLKSEVQHLAIR